MHTARPASHRSRTLDVSRQEVVHSAQAVNTDVAKSQRFSGPNGHSQECASPKGREAMVRSVVDGRGLSKTAAARQFNNTPRTVAKRVERFRAEGVDGLRDRSSGQPRGSWRLNQFYQRQRSRHQKDDTPHPERRRRRGCSERLISLLCQVPNSIV
jgi:hypothetical protein